MDTTKEVIPLSDDQLAQYYEIAQHQMERQHEAYGRLQTKASTLLGFGFVLMGFEVTIIEDYIANPLFWLPSAIIVAALVLLSLTYRSRSLDTAPNIATVDWFIRNKTPLDEAIPEAVSGMSAAYETGRTEMSRIGRLINVAIWLIVLGTTQTVILIVTSNPHLFSAQHVR